MFCHGLNTILSDFFFFFELRVVLCISNMYVCMYVYSRSKGKGREDGALSHEKRGKIIN